MRSNPTCSWGPVAVLALAVGLCGWLGMACSHRSPNDEAMMKEVWTSRGTPPETMPPPEGFAVTPAEAFAAVARAKRLSLKHPWFCYHDLDYYYVADHFGVTANARNARRLGVRVDGQTGAVLP